MAFEVKSMAISDQVRLPYVEQGDPAGTPLLLLHGFACSWREFEAVLQHLPASIRAYALTLRGHGAASKPDEGYRIQDLSADVCRFMEELHIDRAVIAGHSLGSAIALQFAVKNPQKTIGLVLAGYTIGQPGDPKVQAFWDSTVSKLEDPIDPAFARQLLEGMQSQPIPPERFEVLVQDVLELPARVWKAMWRSRLEEFSTVDLGQVKTPTLILWGEADPRAPFEDQQTLQAEIEQARLVVYPGTGHGLPYEQAQRFACDLAAFVEKLGAEG